MTSEGLGMGGGIQVFKKLLNLREHCSTAAQTLEHTMSQS